VTGAPQDFNFTRNATGLVREVSMWDALIMNTLGPVMKGGMPVISGVGSTAVRDALAKYQPMLSLHGHIHESRGEARIGRTLAINPGSEYSEGVLRGAIITLSRKKGVRGYQLVAG
jgi:uncharacterized protein